ncbi:type II toxin-antitoxin system RelE/ParE family toxin [Streptomyces sp. NPDC002130]|uniref:type II toxin-antitoxin system RelE family toxin n=1 Tax=Streptomyces sp. NPDC002130 TaxID=3155568 RepID=UPI0033219434
MKYAFRFTTAAQRQLRAISRPDSMRILTALTALGSYRVAYQINDGELVILVVKVGDRRDVCRNL